MDGDTLYSIGELARRTGLTVKAIRFYSDCGIVPPTGRSPAGHRLYDIDAAARLELVRTLRDLGIDLPTIRKVLDRELSLAQVAAAHAEALATQIRVLRLRRAVATAVARRGSTPDEMDLMHRLARLSDDERRRLIDGFLDAAFGGLDADLTGIRRTMTPELPDDPEDEQVEAWIELAELAADPEFGALMRRVTEQHVSDQHGAGRGRGTSRARARWRWSATTSPPHSRRASTAPRLGPTRSSPPSPRGMPTSWAARTTPPFDTGCSPCWRPRTTRAGSHTSGCSR
ncbi:hypothetical protein GCM10027612_73700 [Microbispora bryophytorum subsp. camponoti]